MKKAKKEDRAKDRLSELPESLIIDILGLLPLTDVVRTTVISKHWKNMWNTIPWLDFDMSRMKIRDKYREFVYGALRSWRGTKMLRFKIVIFDSEVYTSLSKDDIDWWVRFAVEKDVEDLKLYLPCTRVNGVKKMYSVAQDVYSCSSLKELSLSRCNLQIHGNVQWDQLKSLRISRGCIGEKAMNIVLCGSPRLESLALFLIDNMENLSNIGSTSLKRLCIVKYVLPDTELRISTPNLESLRIALHGYSKCLLMNNMPSLSEASLEFYKGPHNFVEEMMSQIIPVIKHVERVSLSNSCIEFVENPCIYCYMPAGAWSYERETYGFIFPNANFLELKSVCNKQIIGVLEMFPNLKNLVLETSYGYGESCLEFERSAENWNSPNSFLFQLRRVDVSCAKGDGSIIPLMRILLKYATNLEKMVVWEQTAMKLGKVLLKIERSYPNEELIFDHTKFCLK